MLGLSSLLVVLALSVLVTRIATVALMHTGLSAQTARFQARSAFTGVGFTTGEAENVTNHPVRRRIIMVLMILGNAGIVTAMASLMLTFVGGSMTWLRVTSLGAGIVLLWYATRSAPLERALGKLISRALRRWTDLDVRDYASLLRVSSDYQIQELQVEEQDWMAGCTLEQLSLRDEGLIVLGIYRADGSYVGAPRGATEIDAGDVLVVYGRDDVVAELDRREHGPLGDQEHERAVANEDRVRQREQETDARRDRRGSAAE